MPPIFHIDQRSSTDRKPELVIKRRGIACQQGDTSQALEFRVGKHGLRKPPSDTTTTIPFGGDDIGPVGVGCQVRNRSSKRHQGVALKDREADGILDRAIERISRKRLGPMRRAKKVKNSGRFQTTAIRRQAEATTSELYWSIVHPLIEQMPRLPNGPRLSCGALKKDSFPNLRAPPASSAG